MVKKSPINITMGTCTLCTIQNVENKRMANTLERPVYITGTITQCQFVKNRPQDIMLIRQKYKLQGIPSYGLY